MPLTDEELKCLYGFPVGTLGRQEEEETVKKINELAKKHGYGWLWQLVMRMHKLVMAETAERERLIKLYQKDSDRRHRLIIEGLNWEEAEKHLEDVEKAYRDIGVTGWFVLGQIVAPLRDRFIGGERTLALWQEIMAVKL